MGNTLTLLQAARRYHLGVTTLRRWIQEGLLIYELEVRQNRNITVIIEDDLISLLRARLPGKLENLVQQKVGVNTEDICSVIELIEVITKTLDQCRAQVRSLEVAIKKYSSQIAVEPAKWH